MDQRRRKEEQKTLEKTKYVEEAGYLVPAEQAADEVPPQQPIQNQQTQQKQPQQPNSNILTGNEAVYQETIPVNASSGEGFTQTNTEEHELETRLKYVFCIFFIGFNINILSNQIS